MRVVYLSLFAWLCIGALDRAEAEVRIDVDLSTQQIARCFIFGGRIFLADLKRATWPRDPNRHVSASAPRTDAFFEEI
jgi:hypothetical protein